MEFFYLNLFALIVFTLSCMSFCDPFDLSCMSCSDPFDLSCMSFAFLSFNLCISYVSPVFVLLCMF